MVTGGSVKIAAKKLGNRTNIGRDSILFSGVAQASGESTSELVGIMHKAIDFIAHPMQSILVAVDLPGKKSGDTRIVAFCSSFDRLLMGVLAPTVREWDQKVRLDGDFAVVGRRAEDEVAKRMLRVECAKCSGQQVALILWDISKFFDSLDIFDTINDAKDLGLPIVPLRVRCHHAQKPADSGSF